MENWFNKIESDMTEVKGRLTNLESDMMEVKNRLTAIEECPTIKKELKEIKIENS